MATSIIPSIIPLTLRQTSPTLQAGKTIFPWLVTVIGYADPGRLTPGLPDFLIPIFTLSLQIHPARYEKPVGVW